MWGVHQLNSNIFQTHHILHESDTNTIIVQMEILGTRTRQHLPWVRRGRIAGLLYDKVWSGQLPGQGKKIFWFVVILSLIYYTEVKHKYFVKTIYAHYDTYHFLHSCASLSEWIAVTIFLFCFVYLCLFIIFRSESWCCHIDSLLFDSYHCHTIDS